MDADPLHHFSRYVQIARHFVHLLIDYNVYFPACRALCDGQCLYRQALKELNAADNVITDLPPELMQLQSLKGLWLYGNQLTSLPAQLARMPQLQSTMHHLRALRIVEVG